MINLKRKISDKFIHVQVDESLFLSYNKIFESFFSSFERVTNFIYGGFRITDKVDDKNAYYCNIEDAKWVFKLMNALEEYYATTLNCTVIHGGIINMMQTIIAIIGKRMSGKSTLINYLIDCEDAMFLTDDCIYIVDNKCYGFNIPISIRNSKQSFKSVICTTIDDENIERVLVYPEKRINSIKAIDYMLFPCYDTESMEMKVERIENSKLFNYFFTNIRHMQNVKSLFDDVIQILRNVNAYVIRYSKCEQVNEWLNYSFINKPHLTSLERKQ